MMVEITARKYGSNLEAAYIRPKKWRKIQEKRDRQEKREKS